MNSKETQKKTKLSAENVNFYYGEKQVIKDVSLSFKENEITALIGPSGCGKSTFLRSLNRMNDLIESSRIDGLITLEGEDINSKECEDWLFF